jgi:cytochrome c553
MNKLMKLALLACLGMSSVAMANEPNKAGDAAKGKTLSATCAACHGADGNSINPEWPKIAGQGAGYLAKQLADYRSDKRNNAVMSAMAKGIASDADVIDLVAYFSSQKAKAGVANDKDKVAKGKAIYKGGNLSTGVAACAACHGPTGSGNVAAKFPSIAGQHSTYIVNQLKAFKSGKRANDTGKMMRNIAKHMTDTEMDAVAEYISGLHD